MRMSITLFLAIRDARHRFVFIEEPENSLHPRTLKTFIECCKEVSEPRQVFLMQSPFVLVVAALYPGRIDLGLGRAPGGDFQTMWVIRRDSQQSGEDFPALLEELQRYSLKLSALSRLHHRAIWSSDG